MEIHLPYGRSYLTAHIPDNIGVDIIEGDQGPLVLEVNASPGFQTAEMTHHADVAGEILNSVF